MRITKLQLRYLREHYPEHSDSALAKALDLEKSVIQKTLAKLNITRTKPQKEWIREHPDATLPPYTGMVPVPAEVVRLRLADYGAALVAALIALALYVTTLGPTVTGEDSGELVTAAYHMGIAHPPGYVIWCILGKLFTFIPYGTIAWRVNFMSAFFGAATVLLLALLIIKLCRSRLAAFAAALAFAFSSEFWEQSVIAEVYSLNAFFIALCLFLLFVWYETRKTPVLWIFAGVYGLSLCNHNTMHFLGPVFILFVLCVDREAWRRWQRYLALSVFALAVAGVVHLYMPIRSFANPPVDWGDTQTWENFWEHVLRKQYKFEDKPRSLARLGAQFWTFVRLYSGEFTIWFAWLPFLGLYPLWKRCRFRFGLILGVFLLISMGFLLILNFNLDKQSLWLNNVFWLPAYMMAAVLMGLGLHWLATRTFRGRRLVLPTALLALAAILTPLATNYYRNDKSDYYFAYDFATNVFATLDENAIYFPTADHATFPLIYLQSVEGVRPDVTIANKYGYPEPSIYADMPPQLRTKYPTIPNDTQEAEIEDWVIANTARPVYFTKKRGISIPGAQMVNCGLLYELVRPGQERSKRDYWAEYQWHTLDEADARDELTAEMVLSDYHFARGRDCLEQGEEGEGLAEFELALRIGGENKETLNNLGSASAEHGALDAATDYYERAIALDPDYELPLRNLVQIYARAEKHDKAVPLLEQFLEKHPLDRVANDQLVDSFVALGTPDKALARLEWLSQKAPDNPDIYRRMGFIHLNEMQDMESARACFAKSLELNPNQPELAMFAPASKENSNAPQLPQFPGLPQLPQMPQAPGQSMPSGLPAMPGLPGAAPATPGGVSPSPALPGGLNMP